MRIATLIIGLMIGFLLVLQSLTIGMFSETTIVDDTTSTAGAVGLLMALVWLAASALVIAFPLVSTILFALTAPLGLFVPTGDFGDLRFHGTVALALAVMAFFGWRGKKRDAREKRAERQRQEERDARLERLLTQQSVASSHVVCPSCAQPTTGGSRFCGNCGAALAQVA